MDYNKLLVKELKQLCKKKGYKRYSNLKKLELINMLNSPLPKKQIKKKKR